MLSEKEKQVLGLLAKGYSYKMIASRLSLSLDTVRTHIKHIYGKMQVHCALQAVGLAYQQKWLT